MITETTTALKSVKSSLDLKLSSSLIDYFYVQKIKSLSKDTGNKLVCGVPNVTLK